MRTLHAEAYEPDFTATGGLACPTSMIWFFSLFFFQFQGPLNLLAEPLPLFALELGFWAICALGASIIIVATTEGLRNQNLLGHDYLDKLVRGVVLSAS